MSKASLVKAIINAECDKAPKNYVVCTNNGKSDPMTYRQAKALQNWKVKHVGVSAWIERII